LIFSVPGICLWSTATIIVKYYRVRSGSWIYQKSDVVYIHIFLRFSLQARLPWLCSQRVPFCNFIFCLFFVWFFLENWHYIFSYLRQKIKGTSSSYSLKFNSVIQLEYLNILIVNPLFFEKGSQDAYMMHTFKKYYSGNEKNVNIKQRGN